MVQTGAASGINEVDAKGVTLLMRACVSGDVQSVRTLLAHGADVGARSISGCTALGLAAEAGHPLIVDEVLAHMTAARTLEKLVDEPDEEACTPLLLACWHGHCEVAQSLLVLG